MKIEFSRHIIEKGSNIKFHQNPFIESRVVRCGQTDGERDGRTGGHEANSRFSQICKRA
jgi:hypothetical protein